MVLYKLYWILIIDCSYNFFYFKQNLHFLGCQQPYFDPFRQYLIISTFLIWVYFGHFLLDWFYHFFIWFFKIIEFQFCNKLVRMGIPESETCPIFDILIIFCVKNRLNYTQNFWHIFIFLSCLAFWNLNSVQNLLELIFIFIKFVVGNSQSHHSLFCQSIFHFFLFSWLKFFNFNYFSSNFNYKISFWSKWNICT